jgi:RNA 3'-terminal phosphate cyclase
LKLNLHARTNIDVIARFLPVRFETREEQGLTRVSLLEH